MSMCMNLKNIPAKFRPDPIWNDGTLDFFEEVAQQEEKEQEQQQQQQDE